MNYDKACVILARGGSKGIPGKNIIEIAGKPLIAHSIEASKASFPEMEIYVSSDSFQILDVATEYGAKTIKRPDEISGDAATSESGLIHALDQIKLTMGRLPDNVIFLQPTSPVRAASDVAAAYKLFKSSGADSLFSGSPCHGFMWRKMVDGTYESFSYDFKNRPRRQDAPHDVIENGSIYIFKTDQFLRAKNRLVGKIVCYEQPWLYSFQIDEPDDIELTNLIFRHIHSE